MKKASVSVLFIFSLGLILAGCASQPPIEKQYPERWAKTYVGMTLEEFRQVWPEARSGGVGQDGSAGWTVFKKGFGNMEGEYFWFKENKLTSYQGTGF
jgi:hypothetical protein